MYRKGFYKDSEVEPPITEGLELYLDAFAELGTCRISAGGMAPIPVTAIADYARHYDVGDMDDFLHIIRSMDDRLMELEREKDEKKKPEGKNGKANANQNNPNQNLGGGVRRA